MLELPEVEVLRKDLEKEVVGKRVKDVVVATPGIVRPFHRTRPDFVKALEGRKVEAVRRRGAIVFLDLDDDLTWILDPGDVGSLHRETATESLADGTHLVVTFTIGGALHLSAPGDAETVRTGIVATPEAFDAAGISPDALDPLDDNPPWAEFGQFLAAADAPLKLVLTDPTRILGIGPVYSDEILWEAGLRHDRGSASLSTQEVRRLYRAMQEVIVAAMKAAGSSLDDVELETTTTDEDEPAEHLHVFGREGLPCHRCRREIKRTRIKKGVYTYHCGQCMI
ncbi:MAG: DNA-formamidopyrimidine glycosylase family protein [Nitriliruptoraceae bacterium]